MPDDNELSRKLPNLALQEERLRRGWTQQEVASRVGTTVVNVSRWERGITFPNPYFRQQLCLVFEKDAEALGLLPVKLSPQGEPSNETALVITNLPSEPSEQELVVASNEGAFPWLRERFWGRRKVAWVLISLMLIILASGGGLMIRLFLPSQSGNIARGSSPPPAVIAQDTFQRANQAHWGTASDGLQWGADANMLKNFSIVNNTAQITTGAIPVNNAILGARVSDAEVLLSGSLTRYDGSKFGAVLRWNDTNNWYKAYLDGWSLVIQRNVGQTLTILGTLPFIADPSVSYKIRFRAVGASLSARVWLSVGSEPHYWMLSATDNSLTEGFCGVRAQVKNGAVATMISFQATEIS